MRSVFASLASTALAGLAEASRFAAVKGGDRAKATGAHFMDGLRAELKLHDRRIVKKFDAALAAAEEMRRGSASLPQWGVLIAAAHKARKEWISAEAEIMILVEEAGSAASHTVEAILDERAFAISKRLRALLKIETPTEARAISILALTEARDAVKGATAPNEWLTPFLTEDHLTARELKRARGEPAAYEATGSLDNGWMRPPDLIGPRSFFPYAYGVGQWGQRGPCLREGEVAHVLAWGSPDWPSRWVEGLPQEIVAYLAANTK